MKNTSIEQYIATIIFLLVGTVALSGGKDNKTDAQAKTGCPKEMVCISGEQPVADIGPLPDQPTPATESLR